MIKAKRKSCLCVQLTSGKNDNHNVNVFDRSLPPLHTQQVQRFISTETYFSALASDSGFKHSVWHLDFPRKHHLRWQKKSSVNSHPLTLKFLDVLKP